MRNIKKAGQVVFLTMALILIGVSFVLCVRPAFSSSQPKKAFDFNDDNALEEWNEHILKNKVKYYIKKDQGETFVQAESKDAASGLYYKLRFKAKTYPYVSWKWKINQFPKKRKNVEDYAARVYVIFPHIVFFKSKCIEYLWDDELPKDTRKPSSMHKNIRQWVVRDGKTPAGKWILEERNIYKDYKQLFGTYPDKQVGAIAFMSDTDDDKGIAVASYDEIRVGYKK
ncbi:MAG: DUF3047 domain-containing protein [Deltaproteobacteria bacterium]|nr:DUF3047 domain-containing protein [Deltaproteobacteria bacterium]